MIKWVSNPRYISFKPIGKGYYALFLRRKSIHMRQLWMIGFTILDRSKELIFDHYYNKIVPALDGEVTVGFTDTDR